MTDVFNKLQAIKQEYLIAIVAILAIAQIAGIVFGLPGILLLMIAIAAITSGMAIAGGGLGLLLAGIIGGLDYRNADQTNKERTWGLAALVVGTSVVVAGYMLVHYAEELRI